jgi:hypothetical protein
MSIDGDGDGDSRGSTEASPTQAIRFELEHALWRTADAVEFLY